MCDAGLVMVTNKMVYMSAPLSAVPYFCLQVLTQLTSHGIIYNSVTTKLKSSCQYYCSRFKSPNSR